MCLWKIDSHYHREKDISCNNKLHRKCVIVDSNGEGCLPNTIRGLSSAPETENWIGCSSGMEDSE